MNSLFREIKHIRNSPLARNTTWMMLGQGFSFLFQGLYFLLLARLLGVTQYGIFAGAFAFTSLVAQYSSLGTGTLFLRYVSGKTENYSAYWGNILIATLTLGTIFCIVLRIIGNHLLNPESAALVAFAGVANCLCAQILVEIGRVFQALEKMRITALLNLVLNFMRTLAAGSMLFFLHHTSAWTWAIVSMSISVLVAGTAAIIVSIRLGPPKFSFKLLYEHSLEGFGYSFAASTSSVYNDIDKTMLSHYGMNVANGIYTMAYRILDISTIPIGALRDAAIPKFFQRGRSGLHSANELAARLLKRSVLISIVVVLVLFFAAPLVPVVVGQSFSGAVLALRWLCLIPLFRSVHVFTGSALTGAGLQHYRTAAQMVAAALNLVLNLWLIPRHGWEGAAWASLVTDGALGLLNWGMLSLLLRGTVQRHSRESQPS